ncbi:MAG: ABC transporter permease [Actinomycetota bacterium]|nr:ABC transporter permease [Actinomycetota bacterium]
MSDTITPDVAEEEATPGPGAGRSADRLVVRLEPYALPGLLGLLLLFFSVLPASADTFPTAANLSFLTGNQAITMLLAVALVVPLVSGHFDFSVGAVAASTSVLAASLMSSFDAPLVLAVAAAVAGGVAIGTVNGVLVARFGMNSFVSTLGVATLLGGLIQLRTGGRPIISGISGTLIRFGSDTWLGVPRIVYVVLVVVTAVWYLLAHTPFGRSLYAIGSNPRAARLVGLPLQRYTLLAFVTSSTLAAVAGVALTARTGGATADPGLTLLFPALAAAFLGATAIQPGRFNVWGTVIGVVFVSVSVSGLTLAGADAWVNPVFNGAALLIAVGLSSFLARRREMGGA